MKCKFTNVNSFAFHVIKTLLQIVEAFQEPYYSHDTSLISIMYAKPDTFDSEDNVACSFLNLQIMHVLQYSRCLHSIKHLTKPALVCLGCLYWLTVVCWMRYGTWWLLITEF